jgi:hypothetical protein
MLSFSKVEEWDTITYEPLVGFMIHLPDRDILFEKRSNMHIANFVVERGRVVATQAYTKAEL